MATRERRILAWGILLLCAAAALGVWHVLAKQAPAQVAAFATRFENFAALGFAAPEGVSLSAEENAMTLTWKAMPATDALTISAQPIPLTPHGADFQADVYFGGTQNTDGQTTTGYQIALEAMLTRQGKAVATARIPVPLSSDKERARLYSLRVPYAGAAPDAATLRILLMPMDDGIAPGTLTAAWLEVLP